MKIAIVGAGGIGGYLGARLAAAGNDVALIARGAHLAALKRNGLRLSSPKGDVLVNPIRATGEPSEVGTVDVVLLAVKLYDLGPAARQMLPMVGPKSTVVPIQNGVTAVEEVAAIVGREHVVGGLVYMACHISEPGVITHLSEIDQFTFGEVDGARSTRVEALRDVAARAGITAQIADDITRELWHKFVLLGGHSPVAGLSRQPLGVIRSDPDLRALYTQAMREVFAVGRARGIALADDIVERTLALSDRFDPTSKASLLGDLEAGKPLEVEWLSGAVVRMGAELGVPTPFHRIAYACLKPFAAGRAIRSTGPDQFS
jgi:2-dehydropantoate 2-reductase